MSILYPRKIKVETFLGCNARCTMCTIHDWARPHGIMDDEVYDRVVEETAEFKDKLAVFSLYMDGEPLMDSRMEKRIAQAKSAGIPNFGFATNGSLLNAQRSRRLLEAGLDWVCVSMESLKKEIYEKIRVRLKFDTVLENTLNHIRLRNQINPRSRVILRFCEQPLNRNEVESYRRYWMERLTPGTDEIQHHLLHNWGHGDGDAGGYGSTSCNYVFDDCVVLRDGTVPLCCVDYNAEVSFGNIMDKPLLEIFNGPEFRAVRERHQTGRRSELKLCSTYDIPETAVELPMADI